MSDIVIDSNFFIGVIDNNDKWHKQAVKILTILKEQKWSVIYFDCVIAETLSALAKRLEEKQRSDEFPGLLTKLQKMVPRKNITSELMT